MKFRFIWIGKTKNKNWLELQRDYFDRLSRFINCEIVELKDSSPPGSPKLEGQGILKQINKSGFVVALDPTGSQVSSHDLANQIVSWQNRSVREINFVIGGANGLSSPVAQRADLRLSLSFLTFTHEMTRVILLEQLYRAYSIINGFPYQK